MILRCKAVQRDLGVKSFSVHYGRFFCVCNTVLCSYRLETGSFRISENKFVERRELEAISCGSRLIVNTNSKTSQTVSSLNYLLGLTGWV